MKISRRDGFTLIEVIIAVVLLGLTIGAMLTSFVMGRVSVYKSRYYTQAVNLIQARAEGLTAGVYDDIRDEGPVDIIIDPGADLEWGTGDDLTGTLEVEVEDSLDLDGDGNTVEEQIDTDGDGVNDPCRPFRISLSWLSRSYGNDTWVTVFLDTVVSER